MRNIGFIGNCQMIGLCFYLQELLGNKYNIRWCLYTEKFKPSLYKRRIIDNLGRKIELKHWADKCRNKIIRYDDSMNFVKSCDVIIYQKISIQTSKFFNEENILKIKKPDAKLIKLPSIFINYKNYDRSLLELQKRENQNNVDIFVSQIIDKNKPTNIMLSINHPTTFLFLEILKEICIILKINFFTNDQYLFFMKNMNFMELPQN